MFRLLENKIFMHYIFRSTNLNSAKLFHAQTGIWMEKTTRIAYWSCQLCVNEFGVGILWLQVGVSAGFMWSHGVLRLALNDLLIKAGPPLNGLIM